MGARTLCVYIFMCCSTPGEWHWGEPQQNTTRKEDKGKSRLAEEAEEEEKDETETERSDEQDRVDKKREGRLTGGGEREVR